MLMSAFDAKATEKLSETHRLDQNLQSGWTIFERLIISTLGNDQFNAFVRHRISIT